MDVEFWSLVIQATSSSPVIWNAVAAFGAMHQRLLVSERPCLPATLDKHVKFALKKYNSAIQDVKEMLPTAPAENREIILMACVLFFCLSSMQGHPNHSLMHAQNGLKLVQEWGYSGHFLDMVVRLDTQIRSVINLQSMPLYPEYRVEVRPIVQRQPSAGQIFSASSDLDMLYNGLFQIFQDTSLSSTAEPLVYSERTQYLLQQVEAWDHLYGSITGDQATVGVLRVRRLIAHILLHLDPSLNECGWDSFVDAFAEVVEMASQIRSKGWLKNRIYFTLATNLVAPLFLVATKCRESTLRRKAIMLLRAYPCREGIWDSILAAKMAEMTLDLEEENQAACAVCGQSLSSQMCEEHRVRDTGLFIINERKARVVLRTVKKQTDGKQTDGEQARIIEW